MRKMREIRGEGGRDERNKKKGRRKMKGKTRIFSLPPSPLLTTTPCI